VPNSYINPDSIIAVSLTSNKYVLDHDDFKEFKWVDGASLSLFEDGNWIADLQQIDSLSGYYYSNVYPKLGKEYMITGEKSGYDKINARTTIPSDLADVEIVKGVNRQNENGGPSIELTYAIKDSLGADFYEI
jgi:hypothetical protein